MSNCYWKLRTAFQDYDCDAVACIGMIDYYGEKSDGEICSDNSHMQAFLGGIGPACMI